jgi:hypothetical protein
MPGPRLQRAATIWPERIQLPIAKQNSNLRPIRTCLVFVCCKLASVKYKNDRNWWTHSLLGEAGGYAKDKHWVLLRLLSSDPA